MSRNARSVAGKLVGCAGLALLVAAASFILRPPAPLTAVEKRLVGNWNRVGLPEEEVSCDMAFTHDRTFHANGGQFVGQWWISSGRLHIKYWIGDWREDWSNWQPVRLWRALRKTTVTFDIRFVGDDRVELSQPGESPSEALIRAP